MHPAGVRACRSKDANQRVGESEPEPFGSAFHVTSPPPGPALCKLGSARSVACSAWGPHSGPRTFLDPPSFVLFSQAFPFLVFQPPPLWAPVSYSNCLTASLTWWTCVWASSARWWWTGRPGGLRSRVHGPAVLKIMSQTVGHDWATELNRIPPWKSL